MQILIIKPSSLGDIICALPVAQSIRDQMPDAVISWIVKTQFKEIVQRCPTVNGDVIEFDRRSGLSGLHELWQTSRSLRDRRFDAVLDFQGLLRSGLMMLSVDSPLKVGGPDAREFSRFACHEIVPLPDGGRNTHAIERLLQFLPAIGLEASLRSPVVINGDSVDVIDNRLSSTAPIVMIPNSRGPHKEWPGFPELTSALLEARSDVTIAWDSHLVWDDPSTSHPDRFFNLTTQTSLLQMVDLLQKASVVIANDSGPLHIAAALGVPTLGLFGPTLPERTGPYPLSADRNNALVSPSGLMAGLSVEKVLSCVLEILDRNSLASVA
ncbi:MAG: glycosyltransferase family 9 protein [Fuerstiella sp.]|nr:glycosyltransferase family 9 protein [Fuerstiella sp.]